jgi:hypothetical protein
MIVKMNADALPADIHDDMERHHCRQTNSNQILLRCLMQRSLLFNCEMFSLCTASRFQASSWVVAGTGSQYVIEVLNVCRAERLRDRNIYPIVR